LKSNEGPHSKQERDRFRQSSTNQESTPEIATGQTAALLPSSRIPIHGTPELTDLPITLENQESGLTSACSGHIVQDLFRFTFSTRKTAHELQIRIVSSALLDAHRANRRLSG